MQIHLMKSLLLPAICAIACIGGHSMADAPSSTKVEFVCAQAGDPAIAEGVKELKRAIQAKLAINSFATVAKPEGAAGANTVRIYIGADPESRKRMLASCGVKPDEDLGDEGYRIARCKANGKPAFLLDGQTPLALACALFHFAERLDISKDAWRTICLKRVPAFKYRFGDRQTSLKYGYNMVCVDGAPNRVTTFDEFDLELLKPGSAERKDAEDYRKRLHESTRKALDMHLTPLINTDEFEFPGAILTRPYAAEITENGNGKVFCAASETLWRAYRAKYAEFVKQFPELPVCMLRLGENYSYLSKGKYVGSGVYSFNGAPYCPRCKDMSYEERIAKTINETRDILLPAGKTYIHRTWDCSNDLIHGNAEMYARILKMVKAPQSILWAVKYTKTDFWRYNFPNPCIGVGGVPQIIEFQCQREYEGKGAFPNFIGEEVGEAYKYIHKKGAVGVWNWLHGGGWDGPILQQDLWNMVNGYVLSHLMWEPYAEPAALAREWAVINFGEEPADAIVKMLLLSDDAVLKWRYMKPCAEKRFGWMPSFNWTRDDKIKGESCLSQVYAVARDAVEEMVAEKEESVKIAEEMKRLLLSVKSKIAVNSPYASKIAAQGAKETPQAERLANIMLTSLEYEIALFKTCRDYCNAYFLWRRWKESHNAADRDKAATYIASWERNWEDYNNRIPTLPGAASLYKDDGMVATARRVQNDLNGKQATIESLFKRTPGIAGKTFTPDGEGFIKDWLVCGPFPNPGGRPYADRDAALKNQKGFDEDFLPATGGEAATEPKEGTSYSTVFPKTPEGYWSIDSDAKVKCEWTGQSFQDSQINLTGAATVTENIVIYAACYVESPAERKVKVKLGSDDGYKLWINHRPAGQNRTFRMLSPDAEIIETTLKKGSNPVLMKIVQDIASSGLCMRFTDMDDKPLTDLKIHLAPEMK